MWDDKKSRCHGWVVPLLQKQKVLIRSLPLSLVHRIAAGEVIDSPVAVVRELVENALDAGADRLIIRLALENWQLQVLDNGMGMNLADLQACALPHSTSKIGTWEDLQHLQTLGFRGEALYSLAQMGHLAIASRPGQQLQGWQCDYNPEGQPLRANPIAMALGTNVTVRDLFAPLPQRRQALQPLAVSLKAIQKYVEMMALVHPHCTWQLWQERRTRPPRLLSQISPGATVALILPQILKTVKASDIVYSYQSLPCPEPSALGAQLTLLLGLPDRCHRHRPDWVRITINHRPVQCPELEQTILMAFERSLPRQRFPLALAFFQLPPETVDFNRHPAKTQVYLSNLNHWQGQLQQAIAALLKLHPQQQTAPQRLQQFLKAAEPASSYQPHPLEQSLGQALGLQSRPLKVVGQVNRTYIVVEQEQGCWLVEQHVAQERVLYEQIQEQWQILPLPQPLLLNDFSQTQIENLEELQLELEPFGEGSWLLRTVPAPLLAIPDPLPWVEELSLGGNFARAQAAIACRLALKNGTVLTQSEMQTLIQAWQRTRHPHTCPHGRPICLVLDESTLARFFRRSWLIGKAE